MGFHPIDRDTDYLLPPSVQEGLPELHLVRNVVDVVEGLDLSELECAYAGRGSDAYHPATLLPLLIYRTEEFVRPSPKFASLRLFRPHFSNFVGPSPTGC